MSYFAHIRRNDGSKHNSAHYESEDELYAKISAYVVKCLKETGRFYEDINVYEDKRGTTLGF